MRHQIRRVLARMVLMGVAGLALVTSQLVTVPVAQAWGNTQYHLNIVAHDNGSSSHFRGWFSMPSSVHAGRVEIAFTNRGSVEHMAQLFRLDNGVSESALLRELNETLTATEPSQTAREVRDVLAISSARGGADGEQPGAFEEVIEHLVPGRYVVVCLETTQQGVPHFELGMAHMLTVWGNDNFTTPASSGTVIETDHQIILPAAITHSRWMTLRINVSSQTHEFQIAKLPKGTTKSELQACLQGPPNAPNPNCHLTSFPVDVVGAAALYPGGSHWIELDLKPGTYVAWCFVPDIHTGMPHALMGMLTVFTVK